MNLFLVDYDVNKIAEYYFDKHVLKMTLETAQLLSTAHRYVDGYMVIERIKNRNYKRWHLIDPCMQDALYKSTHVNHPTAKWIRESTYNYNFAYDLFIALAKEYEYRYGKPHLSYIKLKDLLKNPPKRLTKTGSFVYMPEQFQAIPIEYKQKDPVEAYRTYILLDKQHLFHWTKRDIPYWIPKNLTLEYKKRKKLIDNKSL